MGINISGRMTVKTLKDQFKENFGLNLRVYSGRSFADDDSTIASIRRDESSIKGDYNPKKNTKVGNFEKKMLDSFGIKVQVAGSDDSYLCDNNLTLKEALEKDKKRTSKNEMKMNVTEDMSDDNQALEKDTKTNKDSESLLDDFLIFFRDEIFSYDYSDRLVALLWKEPDFVQIIENNNVHITDIVIEAINLESTFSILVEIEAEFNGTNMKFNEDEEEEIQDMITDLFDDTIETHPYYNQYKKFEEALFTGKDAGSSAFDELADIFKFRYIPF